MFHAEIIYDNAVIKAEEDGYKSSPKIRVITDEGIQETYKKITAHIQELIAGELTKISP